VDLKLTGYLVSVVDYLGFRLIATSKLPINDKTIVSGSSDGGITIYSGKKSLFIFTEIDSIADSEKLNEILKTAATKLNLKPHLCGRDKSTAKLMYTAADTEGNFTNRSFNSKLFKDIWVRMEDSIY
jgi:hypothetical protein